MESCLEFVATYLLTILQYQFSAILVNGFGFPPLQSLLLQMPSGATQLVFLPLTAVIARYIPNMRLILMCCTTAISMMGMLLVWKLDEEDKKGRLVGLALTSAFAVNFPLGLSILSSNVAGFTKRSVTNSMLFIAYCVGNLVAPQFFLASEEPRYPVSNLTPPYSFSHLTAITMLTLL